MFIGIGVGIYWQRDTWPEAAKLIREGANYLKGARGEILVHQALAELSDEYIVFHDFHPVDLATGKPSRWNVDHIVLGPTGVFVLDAKYYRSPAVACASRSSFARRNVQQAQRNSMELKQRLARWSAGDLDKLFVVPIVVYAQPDARVECLREGSVRTLPLRLLLKEITSHTEAAIDQEKAGRVARVLFAQVQSDLQYKFKPEFDAYGELSKAARYAARDARLAQQETAPSEVAQALAEAAVAPTVPTLCPRCGGALVRRVARFGERAGKPFLGCENYAKTGCRYGFNLEE
jgi:hypothetical protein